jgi:hypothetical protein
LNYSHKFHSCARMARMDSNSSRSCCKP